MRVEPAGRVWQERGELSPLRHGERAGTADDVESDVVGAGGQVGGDARRDVIDRAPGDEGVDEVVAAAGYKVGVGEADAT